MRRRGPGQAGNNILEMALVISIFLAIVFGIIEFGRAVWAYNTVAHLAEEGARYAMVRGSSSGAAATSTQIATYVKSLSVGLPVSSLTVNTVWLPNNSPGSTVSVNVQYPFKYIVPYMPAGSLTLNSTARSLIAQ